MIPTQTLLGLRFSLDAMRLDPHGPGHPDRPPHDRCWELYCDMPWIGLRSEWREAARAGFAFALSVCQMPKPLGSLGALLDRAFPPGSLPSREAELFAALASVSGDLRCSRFNFEDGSGARACELSPLFFGGLAWLDDPVLARASRLVCAQAMADSCASRVFFDARAWEAPPAEAMEAFARALQNCRFEPWLGEQALSALVLGNAGRGPALDWPASRAARARLAFFERSELGAMVQEGAEGDPQGRSGSRL